MDRRSFTTTLHDQVQSNDPTTSKKSLETGGSWIGSTTTDLAARLTNLESLNASIMRERVGQDPLKWLKSYAPRLLSILPAGIPVEVLCADTEAFWQGASERVGQCAVCPAHGGACAGSQSAIPDGKTIAPGPDGGVRAEACGRFSIYERRQTLSRTGVPDQLLGSNLAPLLATASSSTRDQVLNYISGLVTSESKWLVLSGGSVAQRTQLLVAILRAVLEQHQRRCLYDWSPQLFKKMLSHMNEADAPNPIEPIREAWFFALDFVDRTKWSPWFLGEMDNLFFGRWGKPMVIGTPRKFEQICRDFEQSGQCFESAVTVDVAGMGR